MEGGGIQGLLKTIWGGCERFVESRVRYPYGLL